MAMQRESVSQPRGGTPALFLSCLILLTACAPPASMQVRKGGEPQHEDEDVLFRATHYFRVFDFCDDKDRELRGNRIMNDTLYRFRMTGKGKSWLNAVRFESGTLRAWQIDPFGASVEFDRKGKPYFVSQQKQEETRLKEAHYAEIDRLIGLAKRLKGENLNSQAELAGHKISDSLSLIGPGDTPLLSARPNVLRIADELSESITPVDGVEKAADDLRVELGKMRKRIEQSASGLDLILAIDEFNALLNRPLVAAASQNKVFIAKSAADANNEAIKVSRERLDQARAIALGKKTTADSDRTNAKTSCPEGKPARRGFQVLGPEGWRTFDQDERLVLAMSSSGRPLLDALRDLSSRIMGQKASRGLSNETALGEALAVSRARERLAAVKTGNEDELKASLEEVIRAFERKGGD